MKKRRGEGNSHVQNKTFFLDARSSLLFLGVSLGVMPVLTIDRGLTMPFESNRIIHFCGWWLECFST